MATALDVYFCNGDGKADGSGRAAMTLDTRRMFHAKWTGEPISLVDLPLMQERER